MSKELAISQNLKLLSESIRLSGSIAEKLIVKYKWKPTNKDMLVTLVEGLSVSMEALQRLIEEQMTMLELQRVMLEVKDEG